MKKETIEAILCQNVTVFLPKTLPSFFQMQEKMNTCRNANFKKLGRQSFGDNLQVTYRNN